MEDPTHFHRRIALAHPGMSIDEWKRFALPSPALAPISYDGFAHLWGGAPPNRRNRTWTPELGPAVPRPLGAVLRILAVLSGAIGVQIFVAVCDCLDPHLLIRFLHPIGIHPHQSGCDFGGIQTCLEYVSSRGGRTTIMLEHQKTPAQVTGSASEWRITGKPSAPSVRMHY